jgi:hypothetical protein
MNSQAPSAAGDLQTSIGPASSEQPLWLWCLDARKRRAVFWTIVVVLGLVQAWSHRLLVDHDGVAYLDIAENYSRGAWSSAINGFYSPLYSWLIAILYYFLKLPRSWESTIMHLVNFAAYLGAYACFEFLLGQLFRKTQGNLHSEDPATGLPEGAWHTLGLGLFLYSSLYMANKPGSTPDIFVTLFVYLAAGLLVGMHSGQARVSTFAVLGATLGFGYLAKTAMFPLSFVFLAVAGLISVRNRKQSLAFLLAPLCFALVAGPWIATLHHATGRYTFGDAGRLTYRWMVGPRANHVEWAGQTEETEHLVHPPRQLSTDPPIFEFATPVAGTFPLWYGNSYWLQGWKFQFSRVGQIRILRQSYSTFWEILDHQKEYLVLFFVLVLAQGSLLGYCKSFLRGWVLWLPAIAAFGMYSLVRVEPRYIAGFIVLFWISLFAAFDFSTKNSVRQFATCAVLATVLAAGVGILHGAITDFHAVLRPASSQQVEVAQGLRKLGILEGQSLATIGIPSESMYWARLARVHVISEIPTANVNQYWFGSSGAQEKVRSLFAQTGAVAIVTDTMPVEVIYPESSTTLSVPGWQRIGNSSYFLFSLRTGASVSGFPSDSKVQPDK